MQNNNSSSPVQEGDPSGFTSVGRGELTDEERKKRAAGLCCFNLLGLVSTAAFICGIYAYAYCDFLDRYVVLTPGYESDDFTQACEDLGYNKLGTQTVCETILQPHGIGFRYWQGTIPVDQTVCFSYTQLTPWGYVSPSVDTNFRASNAFSVIGYVFGGMAWFTLTCSSCCRMDQTRLKGISCYFLMATFFTGLSLIMFRSNVCQKGFFSPYFINPKNSTSSISEEQFDSVVEDVGCSLSLGSKMAISATVLYFICMLMVPFSIVPFYEERYYESDVQQEGQGNTNYRDQPQQAPPPSGQGPVVQGHVTGNV